MLPKRTDVESFAKAVRAAREKQNLSRVQLAERMQIHEKSLARIENGKVTANPKTVAKIEQALFGDSSASVEAEQDDLSLVDATVEDILDELKYRGFKSISLSFN